MTFLFFFLKKKSTVKKKPVAYQKLFLSLCVCVDKLWTTSLCSMAERVMLARVQSVHWRSFVYLVVVLLLHLLSMCECLCVSARARAHFLTPFSSQWVSHSQEMWLKIWIYIIGLPNNNFEFSSKEFPSLSFRSVSLIILSIGIDGQGVCVWENSLADQIQQQQQIYEWMNECQEKAS